MISRINAISHAENLFTKHKKEINKHTRISIFIIIYRSDKQLGIIFYNAILKCLLLLTISENNTIYYWFFYSRKGFVITIVEDICRSYLDEFKMIFDWLGMEYSIEIRREVEKYCRPANPKESSRLTDLVRDSESSAKTWRTKLTLSEIERIKAETRDIWPLFYSETDWT